MLRPRTLEYLSLVRASRSAAGAVLSWTGKSARTIWFYFGEFVFSHHQMMSALPGLARRGSVTGARVQSRASYLGIANGMIGGNTFAVCTSAAPTVCG